MAKDWTQAKIYKMTCPEGYYYYGSTTTSLSKRKSWHKKDADTFPDRRAYKHFNTIGWHLINIALVETVPDCSCKVDLLRAEDKFLREHLNNAFCLNKSRASITVEERQDYQRAYRTENIDSLKQYAKERYENKRDTIRARQKDYREQNKDKIARTKKAYEALHKEEKRLYDKARREEQKE